MNFFYTIPIFLIKSAGNRKTYLSIFFPLLGLLHLIKSRYIARNTAYAMLLPASCLLHAAINKSFESTIRSIQLFLLILFFDFLLIQVDKKRILDFLKCSVLYGLVINFFYLFFSNLDFKYFGSSLELPMLPGLIGEPNYTGLFFMISAFIFLYEKINKYYIAALILVFATASRSMILTLLTASLLYKVQGLIKERRFLNKLNIIIFFTIISYPGLILLSNKYIPMKIQSNFNKVSNGRYAIHSIYMQNFLNHPYGAGYFLGEKKFRTFQKEQKVLSDNLHLPKNDIQQHSIFIMILTEIGIIGYAILATLLSKLFFQLYKQSDFVTLLYTSTLLPLTQLNATHEVIIYIFFAYLIKILPSPIGLQTIELRLNKARK